MKELLPVDYSRFNKGDKEHYRRAYDSFCKYVYTLIKKLVRDNKDAWDLVTEVFIKVWGESDKRFVNDKNFKKYLVITTRNVCIDYLRSMERQPDIGYFGELLVEQADETYARAIMHSDVIRILAPIIERQPKKRRQVMIMRYLQDMSVKDIARAMNIKDHTVYSHLSTALEELKKKTPPEARDLLMWLAVLSFFLEIILKK